MEPKDNSYQNSISRELIIEIELDGTIQFITPNSSYFLEYEPVELIGKNINIILENDFNEKGLSTLNNKGAPETILITKLGNNVIMDTIIYNKMNKENNKMTILLSMINITKYKDIHRINELEERLNYLENNDPLTGLYNRSHFEKEFYKLNKQNEKVGFIVCDLDNLKAINNINGHRKGDEIIKKIACLLRESVGEEHLISRVDGDEFTILLKDIHREELNNKINNIKELIRQYNFESDEISMELSIGYSYSEDSFGNMDNVFKEADDDMYLDKRQKNSELLREKIEKISKEFLYIQE